MAANARATRRSKSVEVIPLLFYVFEPHRKHQASGHRHRRAGRRGQEHDRARRRHLEAPQKGSIDQVALEMRERDQRDRTRAEAPLTQAPDAAYIDSTALTPDEVEEAILKVVRARVTNGKEFSG